MGPALDPPNQSLPFSKILGTFLCVLAQHVYVEVSPAVGLLGHRVHWCTSPQSYRRAAGTCIFLTLGIARFPGMEGGGGGAQEGVASGMGVKWHHIIVLLCISLMINEVRHPFCVYGPCVFLLRKTLLVFFSFS